MQDPVATLAPTTFIDSDHPAVVDFAYAAVRGTQDDRDAAVSLFYRVRDDYAYEPYRISLEPEQMTASAVLERGDGFCVPKAVLLAAAGRVVGIPTRLGFADVRNHLATRKLLEALGSDLFIWHGYTEFLIEGQWVKATPAFNLTLCDRAGVHPLEFDGEHDAVFHPYDTEGRRHMEYVRDHGTFDDLPLNTLDQEYRAFYPNWYRSVAGDFMDDVSRERAAAGDPHTTP